MKQSKIWHYQLLTYLESKRFEIGNIYEIKLVYLIIVALVYPTNDGKIIDQSLCCQLKAKFSNHLFI